MNRKKPSKKSLPLIDQITLRIETPWLVVKQYALRAWHWRDRKIHFYFDTNFFDTISTQTNFKNWNDDVLIHTQVSENRPPVISISPYLLFEYIGLTIPQPPQITVPKELSKSMDAVAIATHIYDQARSFFQNEPALQAASFRKYAANKKTYLGASCKQIFEDSIDPILIPHDFTERVYDYLAWDYVLKHQYGKQLDVRMHIAFPSWYFGWTRRGFEFPAGRFLKVNWDRMYQLQVKKSKETKTPITVDLDRMNKSMDFGTKDDYVDTELLQKLITGTVVNGVRRPVHAFTCDVEQKIHDRILAFKATIEMHAQKVKEETYQGHPLPQTLLAPGVVHICDKNTGKILKTLNVSRLNLGN